MNNPTSHSAVTRLTLGYFGVIMTLSIVFSLLFYAISTADLDVQFSTDQTGQPTISTGSINANTAPTGSEPPLQAGHTSLSDAAQFGRFIDTIRRELLVRLALFNTVMLLLALLTGRYLANRTLRPIWQAIDTQMQFASDASHELRTPLTIMRTELEITSTDPRLTLARAKQALKSNLQETLRLQTLADSLLLLARNETLPSTAQSVADMVEEACAAMRTFARQKQISIARVHLTGIVCVHRPSIVQAIIMLLDNAVKYSPRDSEITITTEITNGWVKLAIIDQGIGIAAHHLPYVRKRFYRSSSAQPGHGLGLSIVEKIAIESGGKLFIDSQPGKGSTFTLVLKQAS